MTTTTAPKVPTGETAINAALAAGFVITRHAVRRSYGDYWHQMTHADGRTISVYTALGGGRFLSAQGYNRSRWNSTHLSARSIPALRRMLGGA